MLFFHGCKIHQFNLMALIVLFSLELAILHVEWIEINVTFSRVSSLFCFTCNIRIFGSENEGP